MCPKSCSAIEYTGFVDFIAAKERNSYSVYKAKPNETYFSLIIKYKFPETVTHHEEYIVMDIYGIVSVIGGTLGLFVGFSFFDAVNFLMTFFQKVYDQVHKRYSLAKIAPSTTIEVEECSGNLKKKIGIKHRLSI